MKRKYFEACKVAQDQETTFIQAISNRESDLCTDNELNQENVNLIKLRHIAENKAHEYKQEIVIKT